MNLTSYNPCYRVLRQNKTLKKEKIKDGMSISYYVNMKREKSIKSNSKLWIWIWITI